MGGATGTPARSTGEAHQASQASRSGRQPVCNPAQLTASAPPTPHDAPHRHVCAQLEYKYVPDILEKRTPFRAAHIEGEVLGRQGRATRSLPVTVCCECLPAALGGGAGLYMLCCRWAAVHGAVYGVEQQHGCRCGGRWHVVTIKHLPCGI